MIQSTLCYLERDGAYLMLLRNRKQHDPNKNKWIGVGGKLEEGESPDECLIREVREETGYTLTGFRYRGLITFRQDAGETEYMHLFTSDAFTGTETACNEGELHWVEKDCVDGLNLWEGDRVFLRLLSEDAPFFFLTLLYHGDALVGQKLRLVSGEGNIFAATPSTEEC